MKHFITTLILIIPMLTVAQWGSDNQQMNPNEFKSAKVQWDFELHDFGIIQKNKPVEIKFMVKNTGNAPLVIINVEPSCGCTAADYTKTPIMPGQKGYVVATYNAEDSGNFSKSVNVTTNANPALTVLKFQGTIQ